MAVTLVRKYDQYDASRPFVAWALGFAELEALAHLRQRGSERLVFDNTVVEQIAETCAEAAQGPGPTPGFSASARKSWTADRDGPSSCGTAAI